MKTALQKLTWTEKPPLSKGAIFALAIAAAGLLTFFKLKPYFAESPRIVPVPNHEPKVSGLSSLLEQLHVTPSTKAGPGAQSTRAAGGGTLQGRWGSGDKKGPAIIERPLFDGLTVTVNAELLNAVSSHAADSPVEARVLGIVPDETTSDVDPTAAEGAKLSGQMTVNMAMKRLGFVFTELVSREGRSYGVSGNAFDAETKTMGIAADYSSGLGPRLLGVGLDQAINLANQVATAKVLQNSTDNSQVAQEMQAASMVVSQQASNSISAEATQGLRSTPAELSLPARTIIQVRIRATPGAGGHP